MDDSLAAIDDFVDVSQAMVSDVQRHVSMIHELNSRLHCVSKELISSSREFISIFQRDKVINVDLIDPYIRACSDLINERTMISLAANELVTAYVSQTRENFRHFQHEEEKPQQTHAATALSYVHCSSPKYKREKPRRKIKSEDEEIELEPTDQQSQENLDDNQVYCYCRQGGDAGDMVGCDAPYCQYEWFHLKCLGLKTIPPDGVKWYCPECSAQMKDKRRKRN